MTTRYYFIFGADLACVEHVEQARKYHAAGWQLVDEDAWVRAWKARVAKRVEELKPKERTV